MKRGFELCECLLVNLFIVYHDLLWDFIEYSVCILPGKNSRLIVVTSLAKSCLLLLLGLSDHQSTRYQ